MQTMTDKSNAHLFPQLGCSLEVLEHLASLPEVHDNFTTADVCFKYIVPLTEAQDGLPARSYAEYIQSQHMVGKYGQPMVSTANQFMSHAWGYNFKETIQNLAANVHKHVKDEKKLAGMYFWMDIAVVNQHFAAAHGSIHEDFWYVAFTNAISSMEHSFFIFDSYRDPRHTKRVWCLWELITAITSVKNTPIMCLPETQIVDLETTLRERDPKLGTIFNLIDCRNAEATVESDRIAILNILEKGMGYDRINAEVSKWLRDWLIGASLQLAEENNLSVDDLKDKSQEERRAQLRFSENIAWLMESVGDLNGAVKGYKRCVELGEVFFTTGDELTQLFIIKTNLAAAYSRLGAENEVGTLLDGMKENGRELLKDGYLLPDTFASFLMTLAASQTQVSAQKAVKTLEEAVEKVDGELKKMKEEQEEKQKHQQDEELKNEEEEKEEEELRIQLVNMRLQMLRNMAVSRNSYEEPQQVREFLLKVAKECEAAYGVSDPRVLRMRYMVAKNNLAVTSLKGQLSLADLKTAKADAVYVMRGIAQMQTDAERSPIEGGQIRMLYFSCVGDLYINYISILERVTAPSIDRLCRFHNELIALETRCLAMMRKQGNAQAENTSNLLNIHFTFARILAKIAESPTDRINQRIEALEAVAVIDPNMTAGRNQDHVQSMLVSSYGIRGAKGDEEKAKQAQIAYFQSVVAAPNAPGLGTNQKRTQQYVAMLRLLQLEQFDLALAMGKAAIAIDDRIFAKAEEERTVEEAEIINNPNWTQYNSNWLKHHMAKAYMGLGEYQLALELCRACMAEPVAGVDLSTSPFLQQFLGEVMAKAKCPPNEFGQEFAKILTRFGYKDNAVGGSTLVMWLKYHALSALDTTTKNNNGSEKVIALSEQWINDILLPVLSVYDESVKREVFIAVLRYRIAQVVTEVNEELQNGTNGSDSMPLDLPAHVKWLDDELQALATKDASEKDSEESSKTKRRSRRMSSSIRNRRSSTKTREVSMLQIEGQATLAHDLATQIYTDLNDGPCAIYWWGESMAHANRVSQMRANDSENSNSDFTWLPFTPESMLSYASALLAGGSDNYPKAILVLKVGLTEFTKPNNGSVKKSPEGPLLILGVLLGKLSVATEDYTTALKWFDWALEIDSLIDGTQTQLNDIWVDSSALMPMIHALIQLELVSRALQIVDISKRHKGHTNVLNVYEELEKWAKSRVVVSSNTGVVGDKLVKSDEVELEVEKEEHDEEQQQQQSEVAQKEQPITAAQISSVPSVVKTSTPEAAVPVENTAPKQRTKSTVGSRSSRFRKEGNCTIC